MMRRRKRAHHTPESGTPRIEKKLIPLTIDCSDLFINYSHQSSTVPSINDNKIKKESKCPQKNCGFPPSMLAEGSCSPSRSGSPPLSIRPREATGFAAESSWGWISWLAPASMDFPSACGQSSNPRSCLWRPSWDYWECHKTFPLGDPFSRSSGRCFYGSARSWRSSTRGCQCWFAYL